MPKAIPEFHQSIRKIFEQSSDTKKQMIGPRNDSRASVRNIQKDVISELPFRIKHKIRSSTLRYYNGTNFITQEQSCDIYYITMQTFSLTLALMEHQRKR